MSNDAPRPDPMSSLMPHPVSAVRQRPIFPHFHLKLTAGYGFEIAVQNHGNGMWD